MPGTVLASWPDGLPVVLGDILHGLPRLHALVVRPLAALPALTGLSGASSAQMLDDRLLTGTHMARAVAALVSGRLQRLLLDARSRLLVVRIDDVLALLELRELRLD